MGFDFYLKTAWKNIVNAKKQSFLYIVGIFLTITLILSLQLWSSTAEDLAAEDFLEDQDYELKVRTYLYQDMPGILNWLNQNKPLIESTSELYYNIAFFNAEEKSLNYRFSPEEEQEDLDDPLSLTSLALFPKNSLERIKSQFQIRGEFDLEKGEVLISEYEAAELEKIYGYPIEPGMQLNLSIARRGPERGEVFLYHCELKHFFNITVAGIYRPIPQVSMLQKTFASSFLRDSIIFLVENMDEFDINLMRSNGLEPVFLAKCNTEVLKEDGIDQILDKLQDVANQLKIAFQSSQTFILDAPVIELEQSYSLARTALIYAVPVIITSMILSLFVTNIVIEIRKKQIDTLKDRGGQKWQIIGILLMEYLILTIIAIVIGVVLSYVVSALIPAFASGTITWASFTEFIQRVRFPFSLFLYIIIGIVIVIAGFTVLKSTMILNNNLEEKQRKTREKIQKYTIFGLLGTGILVSTILLIIYGYLNYQDTKDVYNFSVEQTQGSIISFLTIIILMLFISTLVSIGLTKLLGKLKPLYDVIAPKNSFFLTNTLKNSKTKLSSILVVIVLLASVNVFTLNLYMTNSLNEKQEYEYGLGSDLRIQTSFIGYEFKENLSQIEGIDRVIPVLRAEGKLIYNTVTVIGIDPITYYEIGRWDLLTESPQEIYTYLENLNSFPRGAIVSEVVNNRLNLTINQPITVTGLPNGSYTETFNVSGVLRSAPGFGLTYGLNIEFSQSNEELLFISEKVMREQFAVTDSNLFFASLEDGYTVNDVKEEILAFSDVISVNPEVINEQFIGQYINLYIPKTNSFLISQIVLINLIGIVIIATNIQFLLTQRKRNHAILNTIGNSDKNLGIQILTELSIVNISAIFAGLIIGIPLAALSIFINRPIFTTHNILPFVFTVDYIRIPIFIVTLLVVSALTLIPSFIRFSNENIARVIRS